MKFNKKEEMCKIVAAVPQEDNFYVIMYNDIEFTDYFYYGVIKTKKNDSLDKLCKYTQIVLSGGSIKQLLKWSENSMDEPLILFCVSFCEVLAVIKDENKIYFELYKSYNDSFKIRCHTRTEAVMTDEEFVDFCRDLRKYVKL